MVPAKKFLRKISIPALIMLFSMINTCFSQNPEEEYLSKGMEYAIQGNFEEAKKEFKKSLEVSSDPQGQDSRLYLQIIEDIIKQKTTKETAIPIFKGADYLLKWEVDKAEEELNKAIMSDPNYEYAYIFRGIFYSTIRLENDKAISDFNKALEINPKQAFAYYQKAYVCDTAGRKSEAIEAFRNCIKYASPEDTFLIQDAEEHIKELER